MYLGIDIGGTKTIVGVINEDGTIARTEQFDTPTSYKQLLDKLKITVEDITSNISKIKSCCIAIPGLIDRQNGVVLALGNRDWTNLSFKADISSVLAIPKEKIILENDSRLAGLAEAYVVRYSYQNILYINIGTGIGGALVHRGKLVKSIQDTEFGHMSLSYNGKIRDWQDFASGKWAKKEFGKEVSEIGNQTKWDKIGTNIATGTAVLCSVFQPDVIIFGGGVGQHIDRFSDVVFDYLIRHLHPVVRRPRAILAASYPDFAVLRGCYLFIKQKEEL